eukprot:Selendium_serpulae@DN6447_c1_g2_i2.p1
MAALTRRIPLLCRIVPIILASFLLFGPFPHVVRPGRVLSNAEFLAPMPPSTSAPSTSAPCTSAATQPHEELPQPKSARYRLLSTHRLDALTGRVDCPHPESSELEFECLVFRNLTFDAPDGCVVTGQTVWAKRDSCATVGLTMEGVHYYPNIANMETVIEASATYQTTSTIPITYYSPGYFNKSGKIPAATLPIPNRSASFIARNCRSKNGRESLVNSLKRYIPVNSLSSCLHNTDWPNHVPQADKNAVMKQYALNFAFENGNEKDYVTEKVFDALAAGIVPVYHGAPNIYDFLPSRDCIINVADFNSIDALGEHLQNVLSNDTLLMSYHEWRNRPLPENWDAKFRPFLGGVHCRFCHFLYAKRHGLKWNQQHQRVERPRHNGFQFLVERPRWK